jgi:FkbM family methyltransferase
MNARALRTAHLLWKLIPSVRLRTALFGVFLRFVRNRSVMRTVDGVNYHLDLGELIDVGLFLSRYEPDMTRTIEALTVPGAVVVDIGANVGAHTLRFARKVGAAGRVVAYEPMPYAHEKLRRNLQANSFPHVILRQVALGDCAEQAREVDFRASWRTDGTPRRERARVAVRRLDDDLADLGVGKVDLVKLDVDGLEASILRGARQMLSRDRPTILIEVSRSHFAEPRSNPLELLSELGYSFWHTTTLKRLSSWSEARAMLEGEAAAHLDSVNIIASVEDIGPRCS